MTFSKYNGPFKLKYLTGENFSPDRGSIILVFRDVSRQIIEEDGSIRETVEPSQFIYFENEGWATTANTDGEKNIEPVFFYDDYGRLMFCDALEEVLEDDYEFELIATKARFERWNESGKIRNIRRVN